MHFQTQEQPIIVNFLLYGKFKVYITFSKKEVPLYKTIRENSKTALFQVVTKFNSK